MSFSNQRFAVMSALHSHNYFSNGSSSVSNYSIGPPVSNHGSYHTEVNTLLAGSMMMTLSFLVVGLCLFLHRKFKKEAGPVSLHTMPWSDDNLEVFTLSGQEESTGMYLPPPTPSPPPAYESVVKIRDKTAEEEEEDGKLPEKEADCDIIDILDLKVKELDDDELPTYEAAIMLGAHSYI